MIAEEDEELSRETKARGAAVDAVQMEDVRGVILREGAEGARDLDDSAWAWRKARGQWTERGKRDVHGEGCLVRVRARASVEAERDVAGGAPSALGHEAAHGTVSAVVFVGAQLDAHRVAGEARLAVRDVDAPRDARTAHAVLGEPAQGGLFEEAQVDERVHMLVRVGVQETEDDCRGVGACGIVEGARALGQGFE